MITYTIYVIYTTLLPITLSRPACRIGPLINFLLLTFPFPFPPWYSINTNLPYPKMIYTGSCYCKEITFQGEIDSPDNARTSLCHCNNCKVRSSSHCQMNRPLLHNCCSLIRLCTLKCESEILWWTIRHHDEIPVLWFPNHQQHPTHRP
jgi:hypothetical protein